MSFCLLIERAIKEERADNGHVFRWFVCLIQLAFISNKNIIMSSFKSSRDIQKKEGGPDSCFG